MLTLYSVSKKPTNMRVLAMTMVSQSGAEPLKPSKKGPKPINSSDIEKVFKPLTLPECIDNKAD